MTFKLPENVQETTSTSGTGDVTLLGASAGALTFTSQLNDGDTSLYVIRDDTDLEAGYCVFGTSPNDHIVRTSVYFSTNGGAKVDWPASGLRDIFCGLNGTAIQGFLEPGNNGLLVRTGVNSFAYRIFEEEYGISIANIDGELDNPSFRISQAVLDRLAYLETAVGAPGDADVYWAVTLPDNSLTAIKNVVGYTGTAWAMTRDTAVDPTYPGDFTEGHWSDEPNEALLSNSAETWRFYQYDVTNGIVEILSQFGVSGIAVIPNLSTVPITDFLVERSVANPETEFTVSWSDSNIGVFTEEYTELLYAVGGTFYTPMDSNPQTFSDQISGITYSLFIRTHYVGGKTAESNVSGVTLSPGAGGTFYILNPAPINAIELNFDPSSEINATTDEIETVLAHAFDRCDRAQYSINGGTEDTGVLDRTTVYVAPDSGTPANLRLYNSYANCLADNGTGQIALTVGTGGETHKLIPATRYEQREDAFGAGTTNLEIQVGRYGGTDGGVRVTGTTIDGIAEAGTNFTAKSSDNVDFADGVNTVQSVLIPLTDTNMDTNKAFQYEFDVGSEAAIPTDTNVPEIDLTIYSLVSRANAVLCYISGSAASSTAGFQQESDGTNNILSIDFENLNITAHEGIVNGVENGFTWEVIVAIGAREDAWMESTNTSGLGANDERYFYESGGNEFYAPRLNVPCNFSEAGLVYFHVLGRSATSSTQDSLHMNINNALNWDFGSTSGIDETNDEIDITAHGYEDGYELRCDKNAGTANTGLTDDGIYFVEKVTDNSFKLCTTFALAIAGAGPYVNLTQDGLETHTFHPFPGLCGFDLPRLDTDPAEVSPIGMQWTNRDLSATGDIRYAYIPAVGAGSIQLVQKDPGAKVDAFILTKNSSYSPISIGVPLTYQDSSSNENYGPDASEFASGGTGVVIDHNGNDTQVTPPTISALVPSSIYPIDGATSVDPQVTSLVFTFNDGWDISNPIAKLYLSTGDIEISGNTTISGVSNNIVTFTPLSSIAQYEGETFYRTLEASSINTVDGLRGVYFGFDKTSADFTLADPDADYIWKVDFNNRQDGDVYDVAAVEEDWITDGVGLSANPSIGADNSTGSIDVYRDVLNIRSDPAGSTARGNVLEYKYLAGQTGGKSAVGWTHFFSPNHYHLFPIQDGNTNFPVTSPDGGRPPGDAGEKGPVRQADPLQKRYDDIYASFDIYLDPNWKWIPYLKLGGFNSGDAEQASHGPAGTGCSTIEGWYGLLSWLLMTGVEWTSASYPIEEREANPKNGAFAVYEYAALPDETFVTRWLNRNDPTNIRKEDMADEDFYHLPRGGWANVEHRLKLNTCGTHSTSEYKTVKHTVPDTPCELGWLPDVYPDGYLADYFGVDDLADCIIEVWITDARTVADGGTNGVPQLMYQRTGIRMRYWEFLMCTQWYFQIWNNYDVDTNDYLPTVDQYMYIDNVIISDSRIHG